MTLKTKALIATWLIGYLLFVAPGLALATAALVTVLMLFPRLPSRGALPAPRATKLLDHISTHSS